MTFRLGMQITAQGGQAKAELSLIEKSMARLKGAASGVGGVVTSAFGKVRSVIGGAAADTTVNMRGVAQQLSQVGQQAMATGNVVGALAIQLPDLGLMFGPLGATAGLLAGIALPSLIAAFGGTEEAGKALDDALKSLEASAKGYTDAIKAASAPMEELRKQYGSQAAAAREALAAMAEIEKFEATRAARTVATGTAQGLMPEIPRAQRSVQEAIAAWDEAEGAYARFVARMQVGAATLGTLSLNPYKMESVRALAVELDLAGEEAEALQAAVANFESAEGLKAQAAAAEELSDRLIEAYGSYAAMPAPAQEAYTALTQMVLASAEIKGATEGATGAMGSFASATLGASSALAGAVAWANDLDIAAGRAAASIAQAVQTATAAPLERLASLGETARMMDQDRGGQRLIVRDVGALRSAEAVAARAKALAKAAGGARQEADAVADLIDKLETELAVVREADPVKKAMIGYREQLADASATERARIEELTAAIEREKAASEASKEAFGFLGESAGGTLIDLLKHTELATASMEDLKGAILDAALNALILGEGPLSGLFGGLLGFDKGQSIFDGWGDILKFAGGGFVEGVGTSTSDRNLAWLSNHEFVVNAAATARNRELLEAINAGAVPRFARGGLVGGGPGASQARGFGGGGAPSIHIAVHGARGNAEIQEMVSIGVRQGMQTYDREVLPGRVRDIGRGNMRTG